MKHKSEVCDFLTRHSASYNPSNQWWVILSVVHEVCKITKPIIEKLQSASILLVQQAEEIRKLSRDVGLLIKSSDSKYQLDDVIEFLKDKVAEVRIPFENLNPEDQRVTAHTRMHMSVEVPRRCIV